jgi:hypothetical protein
MFAMQNSCSYCWEDKMKEMPYLKLFIVFLLILIPVAAIVDTVYVQKTNFRNYFLYNIWEALLVLIGFMIGSLANNLKNRRGLK